MITLPYRREPCHGQSVPGEAAVAVDDLSVSMPGDDRLALDGVTLTVPIGSRTALVGPNGAGKSTLLKSIVGLLKPRSGSIHVYGMPVASCLHRVAYLPQRGEIDWRFPMTVRELIQTGRYVHLGWLRRPGAEDRALVEQEIKRLRLDELADRQIGQLSGGQQQRALLARALVQGADLLLLDEPMNAVDVETRADPDRRPRRPAGRGQDGDHRHARHRPAGVGFRRRALPRRWSSDDRGRGICPRAYALCPDHWGKAMIGAPARRSAGPPRYVSDPDYST